MKRKESRRSQLSKRFTTSSSCTIYRHQLCCKVLHHTSCYCLYTWCLTWDKSIIMIHICMCIDIHVYSFTIPSRLWYVNKSVDSLQIFNKSSAWFCKCTVKYKVILGLLSLVLLLVVCIKIKVADRLWLTWRRVKEYCTGETSNLLHWYRIGGGDIKIIMLLVLN